MFGKKLNLSAAMAVVLAVGPDKTKESAPVAMAYMQALGIPVTIAEDIKRFFARIKAQRAKVAATLSKIYVAVQNLENRKASAMAKVSEKETAYAAKIKQSADDEAETARVAIAAQVEKLTQQIEKLVAMKDAKPEDLRNWLANVNADRQYREGQMRQSANNRRKQIVQSADPQIAKLLDRVRALETQLTQTNPDEAVVRQVAEAFGVQA